MVAAMRHGSPPIDAEAARHAPLDPPREAPAPAGQHVTSPRGSATAPPPHTAADTAAPPLATRPGPLILGALRVDPPVVLAPMAGVTDRAFRRVCRRRGAALFVSEMILARSLVEGDAKTREMARFAADEHPRSIQLYGVDPAILGEAIRRLVGEDAVDHVDLNFGCPMPKVTRRGGGAAVPAHPRLLARLVRAAVGAAGGRVPVTLKFRLGLDDDVPTDLETGRIARDEGCAAITLHARTAAQLYGGAADWSRITALVREVPQLPVLGNGDVALARDAIAMCEETGCAGVVIGRGCLGRPWLFAQLAAEFRRDTPAPEPDVPALCDVIREHARELVEDASAAPASAVPRARDPATVLRHFRKHLDAYLRGRDIPPTLRGAAMTAVTLAALHDALARIEHAAATHPRHFARDPSSLRDLPGGRVTPQRVTLPHGWLDHRDDDRPPTAWLGAEADCISDGG
jgi:nifR3 family TIM-barrel protein